MTANPNWNEIKSQLLPDQSASDRPDIVVRVFHQKVKAFINDLLKVKYLENVNAYIYIIKF